MAPRSTKGIGTGSFSASSQACPLRSASETCCYGSSDMLGRQLGVFVRGAEVSAAADALVRPVAQRRPEAERHASIECGRGTRRSAGARVGAAAVTGFPEAVRRHTMK